MECAQGFGFGLAKIAGRIHYKLNLSFPAIRSDLYARPLRRKSSPMMKGAG